MKKKICCVTGTRPEIIKMAPVIKVLYQEPWADVTVLNTAQHRELADPLYALFNIVPDIDLNSMRPNQALTELTANLMLSLNNALLDTKPDLVIAQGDTTTVLATALTSFNHKIPFAHVEAGLRTHQRYNPFPEETNRTLIAQLASLHFAPTIKAKEHLLRENILKTSIYVTGNTIVDAVLSLNDNCLPFEAKSGRRIILVTAHRRENLGQPLHNICKAILSIVDQYPDVDVIFPAHINPCVQKTVTTYLVQHPQISICAPLSYNEFIATLKASHLILTDSGGIQEEASILGKPILILRETTERHEVVINGIARLVGTEPDKIIKVTKELLDNASVYEKMSQQGFNFGDGQAAKRIANIVEHFLAT